MWRRCDPGPAQVTQLLSPQRSWRPDLPCLWKRPFAIPSLSAAPLGDKHSPDTSASPSKSSANLATASMPALSVCPSCVPRTPLFMFLRAYRKQAGKGPCPREPHPQNLLPTQGLGHWDPQLPCAPAGSFPYTGPQFPHLEYNTQATTD